ncbi:MAG: cofactor-independent phosphoglycerate mutase [Clostridia bacterium]|nr:cofactor-independent phosphoglycerate mutase [Clostridia bacterium]
MKYAVVLADGMADYPIAELGNKTPMEYAKKPNIDALCKDSDLYLVKTVPDSKSPGSDVANLAVMGYDPEVYHKGRSSIEAASIGVELGDNDTSFRTNLVTLSGSGEYESLTMKDYSAGEISTEEAAKIVETLKEHFNSENIHFYTGVSYRHLMVLTGDDRQYNLTPPHDISGKPVKGHLPDSDILLDLMKKSREILKDHPVNIKRRAEGKNTVDSIWFWGEGKRSALPPFEEKNGIKGAVISAVDLVKGIGHLGKMNVIDVPNVTGTITTNFDGKAQAAVKAFNDGYDYVYIHLEAPDECGHQGQALEKARSIELIDEKIVAPVVKAFRDKGEDFKIMIMPDHPTPVSVRTHTRDAVPCMIYDSRKVQNGAACFTEKACSNFVPSGTELMKILLNS